MRIELRDNRPGHRMEVLSTVQVPSDIEDLVVEGLVQYGMVSATGSDLRTWPIGQTILVTAGPLVDMAEAALAGNLEPAEDGPTIIVCEQIVAMVRREDHRRHVHVVR